MPTRFPPDVSLAALRHLRRRDTTMRHLIKGVGEFRMELQRNRFESLARAIVAQQISGAAAKSIWKRVTQAVRPRRVTAESLALLADQELRSAGISPQKLSYLRDLQERVRSREIRLDRIGRLPDEEVIAELTMIRGIGVWTAQMFLMFSLGRPDVLPHQDLGIRAAMQKLYRLESLPNREQCEEIAAPWRPYATIACWYCWRSDGVPLPLDR